MQTPRMIVCWRSTCCIIFLLVRSQAISIPVRQAWFHHTSSFYFPPSRKSHLWSTAQSSGEQSSSSSSSDLPKVKPKPDAYKVLGLAHDATVDQVKASYRKLAKWYHPDANPEDERTTTTELFQTIQEAYEVAIQRARYRRDLAKKRDEALKQQQKERENQPFVRLDSADMYPSPTTTEYDQVNVHGPSSPTEAERELRARATGSYQTAASSYNRRQQQYNPNSPHRPWPAAPSGDWGTGNTTPTSTPYNRNPYKAPPKRTPYVYNPNPYRNNYQPPPAKPQPKGYVPHSVATAQPRGPSWSRPRPIRANVYVQANESQWKTHNPYAGGSPSSRPRPRRPNYVQPNFGVANNPYAGGSPSSRPRPRRPNFVQPNFGVGTNPATTTGRRNVFAKRRQPYQPPSSGWWGQTTQSSTGTYTPPPTEERPQPFLNEDYFAQEGQNQ